jgi:hypothetical protein
LPKLDQLDSFFIYSLDNGRVFFRKDYLMASVAHDSPEKSANGSSADDYNFHCLSSDGLAKAFTRFLPFFQRFFFLTHFQKDS